MKAQHRRRAPYHPRLEFAIGLLGLAICGLGIGLVTADVLDKTPTVRITTQEPTTTTMVINSSVIEPETTTAVEPTTTTTAVTVPRKAAPVFRSAVATAPLGTTTTTEAPKIPLEVALKYLGQTGPWADGGFYCARAVSYFAEEAKVPGFIPRDGPSGLYADAVAEGRLTQIPTVDDIVFIDLFGPGGVGHGQVTHVAILEAIDGDVLTVIQGNGEPDPSVITRTTYKVSDGYVLAFAPFTKG